MQKKSLISQRSAVKKAIVAKGKKKANPVTGGVHTKLSSMDTKVASMDTTVNAGMNTTVTASSD